MLHALHSMFDRASLFNRGRHGVGMKGKRDLYQTCGYPVSPTFDDFREMYERQDIAGRIVDAYPDATWRDGFTLVENEDPKIETDFEKKWAELVADNKLKLLSKVHRADRLNCIGRFSILLLGFNDGQDPEQPVRKTRGLKLIYAQPYAETSVEIKDTDTDPTSERFGMPTIYEVTTSKDGRGVGTNKLRVHYSRILHIAENLLENNLYGQPALKRVYNRLIDLDKVMAGTGEGYWQGAVSGISFEADADTDFSDGADEMKQQIEKFYNGLQRYMRLKGVKANQLKVEIADPKGPVEVLLKAISGAKGIPLRILTGSESGELASSQDQENWSSRIEERRNKFAGPDIVLTLVYKLQELGVLPMADVELEWNGGEQLTEEKRSEVAKRDAEAMASYINSGAESVLMEPLDFLVEVMRFPEKKALKWIEKIQSMLDEEEREINNTPAEEEEEEEDNDAPPSANKVTRYHR